MFASASINPSFFHNLLNPLWGHWVAEANSPRCWVKVGYTLNRLPVCCRTTQTHTCTSTSNLKTPINQWSLFLVYRMQPECLEKIHSFTGRTWKLQFGPGYVLVFEKCVFGLSVVQCLNLNTPQPHSEPHNRTRVRKE